MDKYMDLVENYGLLNEIIPVENIINFLKNGQFPAIYLPNARLIIGNLGLLKNNKIIIGDYYPNMHTYFHPEQKLIFLRGLRSNTGPDIESNSFIRTLTVVDGDETWNYKTYILKIENKVTLPDIPNNLELIRLKMHKSPLVLTAEFQQKIKFVRILKCNTNQLASILNFDVQELEIYCDGDVNLDQIPENNYLTKIKIKQINGKKDFKIIKTINNLPKVSSVEVI